MLKLVRYCRYCRYRCRYLDYNPFGIESEVPIQAGFSSALAPLMRLQALGLSHLLLESWPEVLSSLAKLQVLYLGGCSQPPGSSRLHAATESPCWRWLPAAARAQLSSARRLICPPFSLPSSSLPPQPPAAAPAECNPGIARLPAAAAPVLARLRVLSCDCTVLFSNPGMLRQAALLEHLYVRWGTAAACTVQLSACCAR